MPERCNPLGPEGRVPGESGAPPALDNICAFRYPGLPAWADVWLPALRASGD